MYLEAQLVLEVTGDKFLIGMHFYPVPAGVGDHYGRYALGDRIEISRHVDAHQFLPAYNGVVFVDSIDCPSIAQIVLSACYDLCSAERQMRKPPEN